MSRTFSSLRRRRGFISRYPAPLTMDARLVSCPGLFHRSSCIFFSSDDADQFRNASSRTVVWWQPWIYKRGCQEHFSPYAGGADLLRDVQPLSPWKTLVWCPAPGLFHRSSCIFFSSDDADQFRNASSRTVVWWQPWIYLRLVA